MEGSSPRWGDRSAQLASRWRRLGRSLRPWLGPRSVPALLVLFCLAIRLKTLEMIESGGDAITYMVATKQLLYGLTATEWEWVHHTARFGIILPTTLVHLLLGTHPAVYYATPLLFCAIQVVLLYRIALRIGTPLLGLCACVSLILFPQMIRSGSQLLPGVFSATYILGAIYALLVFSENGRTRWVVWSALWCFAAYLTKATNLAFLPGFALTLWLARRHWRPLVVFFGVLLLLYASETLFYLLWTTEPWGRAGIIAQHHLMHPRVHQPLASAWELFDRYRSLASHWSYTLVAYGVAAAGLGIFHRRVPRALQTINVLVLSFFLGLTFAVQSISPLIPVNTIRDRYLTVVAPLLLLLISAAGLRVLGLWRTRQGRRSRIGLASGAFIVVLALVAYPSHPSSLEHHPIWVLHRYRQVALEAYRKGIPVVCFLEARPKPLWGYRAILWPGFSSRTRAFPRIAAVTIGRRKAFYLEDEAHGVNASRVIRALEHRRVIVQVSRKKQRNVYRSGVHYHGILHVHRHRAPAVRR